MKTIATNIISLLKSILTFIQILLNTVSEFIINMGEFSIIAFFALFIEILGYSIYDSIVSHCIGETILLTILLLPIIIFIFSISELIVTVIRIVCHLCAAVLRLFNFKPIINFLNNQSRKLSDSNNMPAIANVTNKISTVSKKIVMFFSYAVYPITLLWMLYYLKSDIQEFFGGYNAGDMEALVSFTLMLLFLILIVELVACAISKALQSSIKLML